MTGPASGTLIGIARRTASRAPMEILAHGTITCEAGLTGDFRGAKFPTRQITVLAREDWEAALLDLSDLIGPPDLPWTTRRANLLVEGLSGFKRVGAQLSVGPVLLEITEENVPCHVMDILAEGLRAALQPDWRAGVACRVLRHGTIALGDKVTVADR